MTEFQYLDFELSYLIAGSYCVTANCRCGHHATLDPADFERLQKYKTLHPVMARLKCTRCGSTGDIPSITISSLRAAITQLQKPTDPTA